MSDIEAAIDDNAKALNLLIPGAGDIWRDTWDSIGPVLFLQLGFAFASESGAATELDYYGGAP